jgi:TonB family protein
VAPSATATVAAEAPAAPTATALAAANPSLDSGKDKGNKDKGKGGTAPGAAVVDTKEPLVGGTLSQEDVRKILEKSGEVFDDCYTLGAGGKTKEFIATIRVKATLGPTGAVNAAQVIQSTAKNPKVDACVSEAFKKIKFPAPKNAGTSVITFPITFGGLQEVRP